MFENGKTYFIKSKGHSPLFIGEYLGRSVDNNNVCKFFAGTGTSYIHERLILEYKEIERVDLFDLANHFLHWSKRRNPKINTTLKVFNLFDRVMKWTKTSSKF